MASDKVDHDSISEILGSTYRDVGPTEFGPSGVRDLLDRTGPKPDGLFTLDGNGFVIPAPDFLTWGAWFDSTDRVVRLDELGEAGTVSTVFLGIDHRPGSRPNRLPLLWETLVLDGPLGGQGARSATVEAAIVVHEDLVDQCRREAGRGL